MTDLPDMSRSQAMAEGEAPPVPGAHPHEARSVRAVLAALHAGKRMTAADVRHAAGLPRRTVYQALRILRQRGMLGQRGSLHDSRQTYFWLLADRAAGAPPAQFGGGVGADAPAEPAVSSP